MSTWVISFSPLAAVITACQDCYHGDGETLIISLQLCYGSQARSGVLFISPGHMGDATSSVSPFNKGCSCNGCFFFFLPSFSRFQFSLFCNFLLTTLGHFAGLPLMPKCLILQSEAVLLDMFTRNQCKWSFLVSMWHKRRLWRNGRSQAVWVRI